MVWVTPLFSIFELASQILTFSRHLSQSNVAPEAGNPCPVSAAQTIRKFYHRQRLRRGESRRGIKPLEKPINITCRSLPVRSSGASMCRPGITCPQGLNTLPWRGITALGA
ncbi:hypothetical protein RRG08_000520 [Elysia crispata]|uniref:Uncharacterized protein n=1 Tax=Elysia crispata TaxID=231223 RepID=A0AAE0YC67_9GAST|nr:hypothetical protein RRG08_000520 [Elysia crispata]